MHSLQDPFKAQATPESRRALAQYYSRALAEISDEDLIVVFAIDPTIETRLRHLLLASHAIDEAQKVHAAQSTAREATGEEILGSLVAIGEDPHAGRVDAVQSYLKGVLIPTGTAHERAEAVRSLVEASRNPSRAPAMAALRIAHGVDEESQLTSFENGTLQGIGSKVAVTIQTHVSLPSPVGQYTEAQAAASLQGVLSAAVRATGGQLAFDVQIGASRDALAELERDAWIDDQLGL